MKHDLDLSDDEVYELIACIEKVHLQKNGYVVKFDDELVDDLLCIRNKLQIHLRLKDFTPREK